MKTAWAILLISAVTDFIINAGTSLMAAMVATGSAALPSHAVLILALIGGLVQMSRTVQQALKASSGTNPDVTGQRHDPVVKP